MLLHEAALYFILCTWLPRGRGALRGGNCNACVPDVMSLYSVYKILMSLYSYSVLYVRVLSCNVIA